MGKKVSADVFPGPNSLAVPMVRQQWDQWPIDMVFPMNYNDFYLEGADWLASGRPRASPVGDRHGREGFDGGRRRGYLPVHSWVDDRGALGGAGQAGPIG